MERFNRAERFAQEARIKKARKGYLGRDRSNFPPPLDERQLGILAHHPTLCSCFMCGNPRKHFNEQTIQELRAQQDID